MARLQSHHHEPFPQLSQPFMSAFFFCLRGDPSRIEFIPVV